MAPKDGTTSRKPSASSSSSRLTLRSRRSCRDGRAPIAPPKCARRSPVSFGVAFSLKARSCLPGSRSTRSMRGPIKPPLPRRAPASPAPSPMQEAARAVAERYKPLAAIEAVSQAGLQTMRSAPRARGRRGRGAAPRPARHGADQPAFTACLRRSTGRIGRSLVTRWRARHRQSGDGNRPDHPARPHLCRYSARAPHN